MSPGELALWKKDRAFRDELEALCDAQGLNLSNVFHSIDLIYRSENRDFFYDVEASGKTPGWFEKYRAEGKDPELIQELKYPRV